MIESNKSKLSVSRQCELLEISRSAYYYKSQAENEQDFEIKKAIDGLFIKHPFKGSRTTTDDLRMAGFEIGRHKVRRLMREMGLQAIYQRNVSLLKIMSIKYICICYATWRSTR